MLDVELVRRTAEREHALVLEEEIALLGKEEAEPRQVDLLLIRFDLREVGVVREVGGEVLRQPVLGVDADVRRQVVAYAAAGDRLSSRVRDGVRLELEIASAVTLPPVPKVASRSPEVAARAQGASATTKDHANPRRTRLDPLCMNSSFARRDRGVTDARAYSLCGVHANPTAAGLHGIPLIVLRLEREAGRGSGAIAQPWAASPTACASSGGTIR